MYDPTCKLGWQANQRFWENDRNQIYGGISYTDDPITQMWYPSYDYFTKNGTLTGVYNYDKDAIAFGNMSLEQRIMTARKGAIKFHPEFADTRLVPSDKAISIAWQNIPNEGGGWANWDPSSGDHTQGLCAAAGAGSSFLRNGRSGLPTAGLAGGSDDVCATCGRTNRRASPAYRASDQARTKYTTSDSWPNLNEVSCQLSVVSCQLSVVSRYKYSDEVRKRNN